VRRAAPLLLALAALLPGAAGALDVERPEVQSFIDDMQARHHLERDWLVRVVGAAETRPAIVEAMSKPAERVLQWGGYRRIFLTEQRIRDGREFCAAHRALLDEVAARTGVPGEIVAAIVGVETSYGTKTGHYRVLDALATLAFDYPARASYFRGELEQFLLLSREAGVDPLKATGSYAGAMGAPQFMPRSYRAFARDGDRDGRIDLWSDWPDIVESVAHYFVEHGWKTGEPVVAAAELFDPDVEDLPGNRIELVQTVAGLRASGVEFATTQPDDARAMLVALRDADGPAYWVGFHNFWVITRYNRSPMYALAVSELAAAIAAPAATTPPVPAEPTG
jgi:membrane-bound lytic murein transglycosylase B